jgi:hypothetical protein
LRWGRTCTTASRRPSPSFTGIVKRFLVTKPAVTTRVILVIFITTTIIIITIIIVITIITTTTASIIIIITHYNTSTAPNPTPPVFLSPVLLKYLQSYAFGMLSVCPSSEKRMRWWKLLRTNHGYINIGLGGTHQHYDMSRLSRAHQRICQRHPTPAEF